MDIRAKLQHIKEQEENAVIPPIMIGDTNTQTISMEAPPLTEDEELLFEIQLPSTDDDATHPPSFIQFIRCLRHSPILGPATTDGSDSRLVYRCRRCGTRIEPRAQISEQASR